MSEEEILKQATTAVTQMSRDKLENLVLLLVRNDYQGNTAPTVLHNFFNFYDNGESAAPALEPPDHSQALNREISNIFMVIGIPPHIKGYQFLRTAVRLCVEEPDIISSITKRLYPDVAKHYHTTPSKVERAIRHAIEVCWNRGKVDNINNVFGGKIFSKNDRPTNGEFIALIADKLLLDGCRN